MEFVVHLCGQAEAIEGETEDKGQGQGRVFERYQGWVAGFCGFSPFLGRGNMLFKRDLKQETRGLLILNACRDLGPGSGLETQGIHHLA
jgi:hypothetical protein